MEQNWFSQVRGTQLAKGAKRQKVTGFIFARRYTPGYGWEVAVQRFMDKPENRFNAAYFIFKLDHDVTQAKLMEKLLHYDANFLVCHTVTKDC